MAEEVTERTQILYDIVLSMDEAAAPRRLGRHEKTHKNKELQDPGERIRASAVGSIVTAPRVSDNGMDKSSNMTMESPAPEA